MDAVLIAVLAVSLNAAPQATYRTPNFVVSASTAEFAKQVGEAAEVYRKELSVAWTGKVMPRWASPCPIHVKAGQLGAGGSTTFNFDRGEVYGWKMEVQGTPERILDSVLPHEVNHTIFACYFRQPLPRWADEGAASLIEHESERMRLKKIHEQVLGKSHHIPLRKLLSMKQYPQDQQQVLTLYAEGYSLADFLIQQSSQPHYLKFLSAALKEGWEPAFREFYGYEKLEHLERELDQWILAGSPKLPESSNVLLAKGGRSRGETPTIRAQSPEPAVVLGAPAAWPKRSESMTAARTRSELIQPMQRGPWTATPSRQPRTVLEQPAFSQPEARLDRGTLTR
jgi:hypothetical protein